MSLEIIQKSQPLNIILDPDTIEFENIYVMDAVKNTIIHNGLFRRFVYSNEYMTLNNIQFDVTFKNVKIQRYYQKHKLFLQDDIGSDIQFIINLEHFMLTQMYSINKIPRPNILEQVRNGFIKFFLRDDNEKGYSGNGNDKVNEDDSVVNTNEIVCPPNNKMPKFKIKSNKGTKSTNDRSQYTTVEGEKIKRSEKNKGSEIPYRHKHNRNIDSMPELTLTFKVSGLWETETEFGLTYKICQTRV